MDTYLFFGLMSAAFGIFCIVWFVVSINDIKRTNDIIMKRLSDEKRDDITESDKWKVMIMQKNKYFERRLSKERGDVYEWGYNDFFIVSGYYPGLYLYRMVYRQH